MKLVSLTSYAKQGYNMLFGATEKDSNSQILDPMSTVVKLAIYNYQPEDTKLRITEHKIKFDPPNSIPYVQGAKRRYLHNAKKEDLHNLHVPIVKALEWYLSTNNQKIFRTAITGLSRLNNLYLSLYDTDSAKIVSQALVLNSNIIKYNLKQMKDAGEIDPEIQLFDSDSESLPEDQELIKSTIDQIVDERNHDIYYQLKNMWSEDEIELIILLLDKYESKKNIHEQQGYLDAISKIIDGKDRYVTELLHKITKSL